MTEISFRQWPKTPRLFRDIVITEKIDGTNAGIHIVEADPFETPGGATAVNVGGTAYFVAAQSRKRLITPESDNYGFAKWVWDNAGVLAAVLGEGLHFGEWWGQGIQRRYDQTTKNFSLFNTARFDGLDTWIGGAHVDTVPVLYEGPFDQENILCFLNDLKERGSFAAPGFMDPEGICVYHTQTRSVFKVTLDHNDAGKWEVA
ncbi:RNA ligase family protein [Streptomyces sp. NPDC002644]